MTRRLLLCALLASAAAAPLGAADIRALIDQGDAAYAARTETAGAREALALYEGAIQAEPASAEALWKAARALYWLADHAGSRKDKLHLFEKGIEVAKKAIVVDPQSVDAHFWLGGLYGSYGEARGVMKSLALVKPIRKEMETIIRLNERYQGGAGYRVLGIVDYKVPGIAGGSKKRARENLKKAMAIDPANAFNLYYTAEFLETAGQKKEALENLNALDAAAVTPDVDQADLKMIQERGRKLRKRIER